MNLPRRAIVTVITFALLLLSGVNIVAAQQPEITVTGAAGTRLESLGQPIIGVAPTTAARIWISGSHSSMNVGIGPAPLNFGPEPGMRIIITSAAGLQRAPMPVPALPPIDDSPVNLQAEAVLGLHHDPVDGAAGVKLGISRVFDASTDDDVAVLLKSFHAQLSYDGSCINVLAVRPLDFTPNTVVINNATGTTDFNGVADLPVSTPSSLNHAVVRLAGSNQVSCAVTLELTDLIDDRGNQVLASNTSVQGLLRGDARVDGVIDITDALFIAQHLVGLRKDCTNVGDTTCLHTVNAASVRPDDAVDENTIADALFIAQYLVGLRDEFYNPLPQ